ncbi:MAG: hypothetical protein IKG72_13115 [Bacillus sp. (in: Bacteria)]|nr:hypothetical protein [Parasporobacterium sp.]MBR3381023.1 hypothetical protein [Bacillus sp. (in: firmicutes)]
MAKRNRVVQILMDRDGITEEEAEQMVNDCRSELWDAINGTSVLSPEEVIEGELGLEPDYFEDILGI